MTLEYLLRLLLAAGAGGVVGLEREFRGHVAGVRTHALVAVGAALFTIAGIQGSALSSTSDPTRLAAQVVSGIGFVGAGAILRDRSGVRGLTTAATIWASGSLGVVAALSNVSITMSGMGIMILILISRRPVKWVVNKGRKRTDVLIQLEYDLGHGTLGPLVQIADETDSDIIRMTLKDNPSATPASRTANVVLRVAGDSMPLIAHTIEELSERQEVRTATLGPDELGGPVA